MARSPLQYAKVACKVHQDPEFRRLPRDTRLLWMTLLTTEHAQNNPPGLWRASDLMMLDDLADFTQEELDKHRRVLEKAGMLQYDAECRIWWRVKSVRAEYNTPDTWQAAVSWARKLAGFERCPLIVEYILAIVSQVDRWPKRAREAFVPALQSCGVDPATIAVDERYLDSPTCRALHPMGDGSKKHGGSVSGNLFRVSEGYAYGNGTVTLPSAGAGAGAGAGSVRSGSSDRDREIVKDPGSTEPGGNGKKPGKTRQVEEALHALSRCERFKLPDPMERKHWVMLSEMLKLVPLEKWPVLVDWVAAGGGFPSEIDLGRLRAQITTWSPQAVSWDAKKRPRLTDTKKDPEKGIASNLCDYEEPKDA